MTRHTFSQNNFTSGRLDKKSQGRVDIGQYKNGLDEMLNFIPLKSGGARLRPGVRLKEHVSFDEDSIEPPIAIHDIVYQDKKYTLYITNHQPYPFYIKERENSTDNVYNVSTFATQNPEFQNITSVNPTMGYPQQSSLFGDSNYPVQQYADPHSWRLLKAQDQYIFVSTSGLYEPLVLLYTSLAEEAPKWWITEYSNIKLLRNRALKPHSAYPLGYPYIKNRDKTLTVARTETTLTDNYNVKFPTGYVKDYHPDKFLRVVPDGGSTELTFYVNSVDTAANTMNVKVIDGNQTTWGALTPTPNWALSTWNRRHTNTDTGGFPTQVTSYEQRIVFASSYSFPGTLWFSSPSDTFILTIEKLAQDLDLDLSGLGYSGPITDNFAFDIGLASSDIVEIMWLRAQDSLLVGAKNAEYRIAGSEGKFGPLTKEAISQTSHGSSIIEPQSADRTVLFVSADRQEVKEIGYDVGTKQYLARSLSTLSNELVLESDDILGGIKKIVWMSEDHICWILLDSGSLIGFSKEDNWEVLAWFTIETPIEGSKILDIAKFSTLDTDIKSSELHVVTTDSQNSSAGIYHGILSAEYSLDKAQYFPELSNGHIRQFRYLDFSLIDEAPPSSEHIPITAAAYDEINSVLTVTDQVFEHEKMIYKGADWGVLSDGDVVFIVSYRVDSQTGRIDQIQLALEHLATILTLPEPTDDNGYLYRDGYQIISDRFLTHNFNLPLIAIGDRGDGEGFKYIGTYDWLYSGGGSFYIDLKSTWKTVLYGYSYVGRLKSLNYEPPQIGQYNNLQVMYKRIDRVLFKVYRMFEASVGSNLDNMYSLELPSGFVQEDLSFYTGDIVMDWDATTGEQQRILLEVNSYTPCTVLGFYIRASMGAT
jgi:hypothetical protein